MAFTYEHSDSDRDRVRLLISDVDSANPIFQDAEIEQFLALAVENVFAAASLALRTMAGNEAMVLKRITLLDLTTDGPATAAALRALADDYDRQARSRGRFAVAEMIMTPSQRRERLARRVGGR